jgi:hypothetical protein
MMKEGQSGAGRSGACIRCATAVPVKRGVGRPQRYCPSRRAERVAARVAADREAARERMARLRAAPGRTGGTRCALAVRLLSAVHAICRRLAQTRGATCFASFVGGRRGATITCDGRRWRVFCVYCGREKGADEFTQPEHVWPQALGGNIVDQDNPFVLRDVCDRCNRTCGRHVDGPFIKSVLVHNWRVQHRWRYADVAANPALPLFYMGHMPSLVADDGRACVLWLGPTGDRVYHFARTRRDGGDRLLVRPVQRQVRAAVDPDYAFLFVQATNPAWHRTLWKSVTKQFSECDVYIGNAANADELGALAPPAHLHPIWMRLRDHDPTHELNVHMSIGIEDRFLAKLALGFGRLTLADAFARSADADTLRQFLWGKTREERATVPVRGAGFADDVAELRRLLAWDDVHIIVLSALADRLVLSIILYGQRAACIHISSDPAHWHGRLPAGHTLYVIVPGLQRYAGPLGLGEYVGWRYNGLPSERLESLQRSMDAVPPLPPFDSTT